MQNKRYQLILLFLLLASSVYAQVKGKDTSMATNLLSEKLSISKQRAEILKAAFRYKEAEIQQLLKEKKMSVKERNEKLNALMTQRREHINNLLSKEEEQKLLEVVVPLSDNRRTTLGFKRKKEVTQQNKGGIFKGEKVKNE
jgi:flagellar motility protein MotE (MotC chaperone)